MIKIILKSFFLIAIMMNHLEAKNSNNHRDEKIYNLSVCAILSRDLEFLTEWIEYHTLTGVDHFYLYNVTGKNLRKKLDPYLRKGIVELIEWHGVDEALDESLEDYIWALSSQVSAYENAIQISAKKTTWLVFLDINEFLVTSASNSIVATLARYFSKPGLAICSTCYEIPKSTWENGLIIQNYKIAKAPLSRPQKEVSKTIFKPDACNGFMWPPYQCKFKSDQKPITLNKSDIKINKYVKTDICSSKENIELDYSLIPDGMANELLEDGYEIVDHERAIEKYVPELLENMRVLN